MKHEIAILLRRFLLGKTSEEEQEKLDSWYRHQAGQARPNNEQWPGIKERIWQQVQEKVRLKHRPPIVPRWVLASVAATVLVILGLSGYLSWHLRDDASRRSEVQEYLLTAQVREIKEFQLDDGTHVWLNAQSSLRYTSGYGKKSRTVVLDGEALFDVAHNPTCPFIVQTSTSITRVLGTRFSVRAYSGEQQQVSLTRGKVQVSFPAGNETPDYTLNPGEMVRFSPDTEDIVVGRTGAEQAEDWTKRILHFDSRPLSEVFATLERTYGVSIRVTGNGILQREYTASFANEGLPRILRSLSLGMSLSIEQVNDTIIEVRQ